MRNNKKKKNPYSLRPPRIPRLPCLLMYIQGDLLAYSCLHRKHWRRHHVMPGDQDALPILLWKVEGIGFPFPYSRFSLDGVITKLLQRRDDNGVIANQLWRRDNKNFWCIKTTQASKKMGHSYAAESREFESVFLIQRSVIAWWLCKTVSNSLDRRLVHTGHTKRKLIVRFDQTILPILLL